MPEGRKHHDKLVYVTFDRNDALAALIGLHMTKCGFSVLSLWHPQVVHGLGNPFASCNVAVAAQSAAAWPAVMRACALYDRGLFYLICKRERVYPKGFTAAIDV